MEDICDNTVHPDPYYQQGGDMVRVGGNELHLHARTASGHASARCPAPASRSRRNKVYKCELGPSADGVSGEPVWEVLSRTCATRRSSCQAARVRGSSDTGQSRRGLIP